MFILRSLNYVVDKGGLFVGFTLGSGAVGVSLCNGPLGWLAGDIG